MDVEQSYSEDYLTSTYGDFQGLHNRFISIRDLPTQESDNSGRVGTIVNFARRQLPNPDAVRVLDVGSGIGIFPYSISELGWSCVAIDPDPRSVEHLNNELGIRSICTEFQEGLDIGQFNVVSFNKVLEHIVDPIDFLRSVKSYLLSDSFVYIEVPDGEMAEHHGYEREEFTIDHHHIFSFRSLLELIYTAGLLVVSIERLVEPSTKYTIRAFCTMPTV